MDLGQIFTVEKVASLMTNMFDLDFNAKIMDPCFGSGAFLKTLSDFGYLNVIGYEIDKKLYTETKRRFPQYHLRRQDFLGAEEKEIDGIIMNPPYVRHEKINDLESLGVSKQILSSNEIYNELPNTANLYMYFIIKAFSLLREGGEMIVIFPSSWIKARSGAVFQKLMYKYGEPLRQIHISGEVFEKNALVEVVILKLKKGYHSSTVVPEYLKLENDKFTMIKAIDNDEHLEFEKKFQDMATIRRGLTTGFNKMYINPESITSEKCLRKIISSPKDIDGYTTNGARIDYLFAPQKGDDNEQVKEYIKYWKKLIKAEGKPQTLVDKISRSDDWYRLNLFDCKGIIFSYFVRNDMKFIFNKTDYFIRDNFYVIKPKIDLWIVFALLNNYYTYYQLECLGKRYGAGLLKLQRYDIEQLTFIDESIISEEDRKQLKKKAKKLTRTGEKSIIADITRIISRYSVWNYEEIEKKYNEKKMKRLEEL